MKTLISPGIMKSLIKLAHEKGFDLINKDDIEFVVSRSAMASQERFFSIFCKMIALLFAHEKRISESDISDVEWLYIDGIYNLIPEFLGLDDTIKLEYDMTEADWLVEHISESDIDLTTPKAVKTAVEQFILDLMPDADRSVS